MNKTRVPSAWIVGLFICISFITVESTFHFEDALAASIVEEALAGVSVSSVGSGSWSDPTVWSTGAVPGAGDSVRISQGTTVTYDLFSDVVLGELLVEGTLRFSRTENTRLKTSDNIMVTSGGFFDMGTAPDPIPNGVMSELIFVLAEGYTFTGGPAMEPRDKGVWVMNGSRWEVQHSLAASLEQAGPGHTRWRHQPGGRARCDGLGCDKR